MADGRRDTSVSRLDIWGQGRAVLSSDFSAWSSVSFSLALQLCEKVEEISSTKKQFASSSKHNLYLASSFLAYKKVTHTYKFTFSEKPVPVCLLSRAVLFRYASHLVPLLC